MSVSKVSEGRKRDLSRSPRSLLSLPFLFPGRAGQLRKVLKDLPGLISAFDREHTEFFSRFSEKPRIRKLMEGKRNRVIDGIGTVSAAAPHGEVFSHAVFQIPEAFLSRTEILCLSHTARSLHHGDPPVDRQDHFIHLSCRLQDRPLFQLEGTDDSAAVSRQGFHGKPVPGIERCIGNDLTFISRLQGELQLLKGPHQDPAEAVSGGLQDHTAYTLSLRDAKNRRKGTDPPNFGRF